jgi:hypothetical protein
MASLDKNVFNGVQIVTGVHSSPPNNELFNGHVVFIVDSQMGFILSNQEVDGIRARGMETGSGVLGEGGRRGPGVVGVAGDLFGPKGPGKPTDHAIHDFDFPQSQIPRQVPIGVVGVSDGFAGVHGLSNNGVGVVGVSQFRDAVVGDGRQTGSFNAGCHGITHNGYGVYGEIASPREGEPNPDAIGVFGAAVIKLDNQFHQIGFVGQAGVFVGPVAITGDLKLFGDLILFGGTKSAAIEQRDGSYRLLYCMESPESWFEDFGEGQLVKGKARVQLDHDFVSLVHSPGYHVFISPYGDSKGLYVSRQTAKGFEVREQQGGASSLKFSYRVVGKRRDIAGERLARVEAPPLPNPPRAPESFVAANEGGDGKTGRPRSRKNRQ